MDARQRACTAVSVAIGSLAIFAVGVVAFADDAEVRTGFISASVALGTAFAVVGLLLIGWRRGNHLGLVLLVAGSALVGEFVFRSYGYLAADHGWLGARAATWFGLLLDPLFFPASLVLVFLLFPEGRLPSRRWRVLPWLTATCAAVLVVLDAVRPGPLKDESFGRTVRWSGVLPRSAADGVDAATGLLIVLLVLQMLVAAVLLVVRFRRSTGVQRQQLKPLLAAVGVSVAGLLVQNVPGLHPVGVPLFVFGVVVGLPLAIAVGALRYRLWDLDRVVVATMTYVGLAALVIGVYVLVVVGLVGLAGADRPRSSLLPSVVATAVVALLFAPTKDWLAAHARRVVYGPRADPYQALATLPHQLSVGPGVEEVLPLTARTLVDGLGVPAARVRARLRDGSVREAWAGGEIDGTPLVVREVRHLGEVVGDIAVLPPVERALGARDEQLLADLAAQAGPAVRGVVLSAQLQEQLTEITQQARELRDSQARIARAAADERRRLERDIHDGAQQQLVGLAIRISDAETLVRSGDLAAASAMLTNAHAQLDACIDTVRELARGIYPPVLTARGLVAALRARTRSFPGHASVTADDSVEGDRFGPEIELALYFCCLEALQNAAKHAPGATVTVEVRREDDLLELAVGDDGPGIDPARRDSGTGLVGMRDRVAAVGGSLTFEARPGGGTTIRAQVPLH